MKVKGPKFKVGDKVKILDGSEINSYTENWAYGMCAYIDQIDEVREVIRYGDGRFGYRLKNAIYTWDERGLEPYYNETIVIYRKDNEVIALDKRTGKKAIAKCSPEDTFDFNIGAKLAFGRLMNSNKEIRTVNDMRKKLNDYCKGRICDYCKLKYPTCRCGCGTHFMKKDDAGNYTMSNREIKAAFNIIFGTGIKEVKRRAKQGEYVKIVDAVISYGNYKNGDILQIVDDTDDYVRYGHNQNEVLYDYEYVVLEDYKPDEPEEPKEPHKFKVGDIVKGNLESDERYHITNSDMTRGKIVCVSGDIITIEVLNHKTMPDKAGNEYDVESKYFDIVAEPPKLYNGKIIFTKGDETFKTGYIYEIKDGKIMLDNKKLPYWFNGGVFRSIEDVRRYFDKDTEHGWRAMTLELIEVVDD